MCRGQEKASKAAGCDVGETRVGAWRRASSFPKLAIDCGAFFTNRTQGIRLVESDTKPLSEGIV